MSDRTIKIEDGIGNGSVIPYSQDEAYAWLIENTEDLPRHLQNRFDKVTRIVATRFPIGVGVYESGDQPSWRYTVNGGWSRVEETREGALREPSPRTRIPYM